METHPNPVQYLQHTLSMELRQLLIGDTIELPGVFSLFPVKSKSVDRDFHIPEFIRRLESLVKIPNGTGVDISDVLQLLSSSHVLDKYIKDINITSNGLLALKLHRTPVTQAVINNVLTTGRKYGMQNIDYSKRFSLVESVAENDIGQINERCAEIVVLKKGLSIDYNESGDGEIGLEDLRTIITCTHLRNILVANGVSIRMIPIVLVQDSLHKCQAVSELLSMFDNIQTKIITSEDEDYIKTVDEVEEMLTNVGQHMSEVSINKNLIHQVSNLVYSTKNLPIKGTSLQLVNITSCRKLYCAQQSGLVWQTLSKNPLAKHQTYISLGKISANANGQKVNHTITLKDVLRTREGHLRLAYLLKYGDVVKGAGWEETISSMAVATIKLQIMATAQNNEVKFDQSEDAQGFRQATFVMYNCARLAKLLHNFEQSVQQGLYPSLPKIDQIDFSLLRDNEEWYLLLRYVMTFPSTISESVQDLLSNPKHDGLSTAHVNKITCFLFGLSQDFSSYYQRVHVLGEPRPHLFPTMFARLYLLKAVQQVYHNGLALLDIQPLSQM